MDSALSLENHSDTRSLKNNSPKSAGIPRYRMTICDFSGKKYAKWRKVVLRNWIFTTELDVGLEFKERIASCLEDLQALAMTII